MEPEKDSSSSAQNPSGLLGLLGTLAFSFALWAFSKSNSPNNETSEPIPPQDDSEEKHHSSNRQPTLVPQFVPPPEESRQTERRKRHTPWWKVVIEGLVAAGTVGLLIVNLFLLPATKKAADAANSAAETAHETLIASNRPWMTAEIHITGPLTFDKTGMHLRLLYTLKNIGHSPAMSVWSDEELTVPRNPQRDTESERIRLCSQTQKLSVTMGQVVFPGDGPTGTINLSIGNGDIQTAVKPAGFIFPAIIGCIAYQSTIDKDWHFTGMIFDILKVDERGVEFAIKNGENVPLDRLRFGLSFFHGMSAN